MNDHNYELVPTALAVKALRDAGYRNTAYAIAELIDNAIQATASNVELLCCEREFLVNQRIRRNIHKIAVLDNGIGMDSTVLSTALQFGNGQYLNDRSGIGRFGMGLPSSSISQCRKVEVWTWQQGPEHAIYSYIDLEDVEGNEQTYVPEPHHKKIPDIWRQAGDSWGESGTIVVWSILDRCLWKTALAIIRNSEYIIGRMYRRFIQQGIVSIRLASFVEDKPTVFEHDTFAKVNDPNYIMVPSSAPDPYDNAPMFNKEGDHWEITQEIGYNGETYPTYIRFTIAKEEARNKPNAGNSPHGRHAKRNIGISLVRAERELELEKSLVNGYDPRERWWGVEVEFPPELDEIFGVTNNKQEARHFTEIAQVLEDMLTSKSSISDLKERMREESDPRGPLLEVIHLIDRRLRSIRGIIKIQTKGTSSKKGSRHELLAEELGTEVTRKRQQEGFKGASDKGEILSEEIRIKELSEHLQETGLAQQQAQELAAQTIGHGIKYAFTTSNLEGSNFFTVKAVAGEILIALNVNHPAYENLVEVLEDNPDDDLTQQQLLDRLATAQQGLKLLLMAWARYEDESYPESRRRDIQNTRFEWGKYASQFLEDER